jgi:hypothetical protein
MTNSYKIEKLPDLPVVLVTIERNYDVLSDLPRSNAEGYTLLDQLTEAVFFVNDIRSMGAGINLDTIIQVANEATRGKNPVYLHKNVREVIFITLNPAIQLAAQGLFTEVFGHTKARAFSTLDDTLAYIRTAK